MSRIIKRLTSWLYPSAGNNSNNNMNSWRNLKSLEELDEALSLSHSRPIVVFKHSVRCGISAAIHAHLKDSWDLNENEVSFYYLDLIQYRSVSDEIASRLNTWHQSPQLLLIFQAKVVYHVSHHAINTGKIKAELNKLPVAPEAQKIKS